MNDLVWLWIVLGLLALVAIFIIALFNSLVRLNNRVKKAYSDINIWLKQRADLLGNLVETVKGSAKFEKETIEKVTEARSGITEAVKNGAAPAELAQAENVLTKTVGGLHFEAYPNLQTVGNFKELMTQISDIEDKIQSGRRFYNGGVTEFNTKIETFPNNLFANILKFTKYDFFETEDRAELETGHSADKSTVSFEG
ncbi:MAG: LemA family protein [Candidatus Nomurabacteria bacterium]|jgi:LemA protein|nr:LemA family protein [Candidatus Nomurabacteria bacterium]